MIVEHKQIGAWTVAAIENIGARTRDAGAVLPWYAAADTGGRSAIQSIVQSKAPILWLMARFPSSRRGCNV